MTGAQVSLMFLGLFCLISASLVHARIENQNKSIVESDPDLSESEPQTDSLKAETASEEGSKQLSGAEMVAAIEQPEYLWLVQSGESIVRYESEEEVKNAILAGIVLPDMKAKKITGQSDGEKSKEEDWARVDMSLGKSSFGVRQLFQPIWAHTVSGVGIGSIVGIVLWLGSWVFIMIDEVESYLSAGVVALFLVTWVALLFPEKYRGQIGGLGRKAVLIGMAIFTYTFFVQTGQLGPVFNELFFGFQVQLGASIGGAAAGVFPGMVLGTLVGFARRSRLEVSRYAVPEGFGTITKGIILPIFGFVTLAYLYIEFLAPWLIEFLSE